MENLYAAFCGITPIGIGLFISYYSTVALAAYGSFKIIFKLTGE